MLRRFETVYMGKGGAANTGILSRLFARRSQLFLCRGAYWQMRRCERRALQETPKHRQDYLCQLDALIGWVERRGCSVATCLYWPTDSRTNFVPLSRTMFPVLEFTAAVGGVILVRGWSSTSVNP